MDKQRRIEEIRELLATEWELEELADEAIHAGYGETITILGAVYSTAAVLAAIDPRKYRGIVNDVMRSLAEERDQLQEEIDEETEEETDEIDR